MTPRLSVGSAIDQANWDWYAADRIRRLVDAYLAPTPRAAVHFSVELPPDVDGRQRMAPEQKAVG